MKDDGRRTMSFPRGVYEQLITDSSGPALADLGAEDSVAECAPLDDAESPSMLATHIGRVVERLLRSVDTVTDRVALTNAVLHRLDELTASQGPGTGQQVTDSPERVLRAVQPLHPVLGAPLLSQPEIGLSRSDLLVNGRGEPNLSRGLLSEIGSADRIDLIVSFIRWTGLRLVLGDLERARHRGVEIRVLTTTYLGASEQRAVDALVDLGADVKISYDARVTRLHAKGWLFHRRSGFHTAYIGSSNLSRAAMVDGQEWNVRLSAAQTPALVEKFRATFNAYWADPQHGFDRYDPRARTEDRERLRRALAEGAGGSSSSGSFDDASFVDVTPYPYQQQMLEDLEREREVYSRHRNLVVAATGTGKTVVAALDYRRLAVQWTAQGSDPVPRRGGLPSLLFVAHRAEILKQSRSTFRQVLRRGDFGELLVDGQRPIEHRHVFASIQSLSPERLAALDPSAYDIVIVDEFHHAEAPSYRRLLDHLKPKVLLGLTATPERMDGADVLTWFDGHVATELRLWDALDRGLLTPFHYFGVGHEQLDFKPFTPVSGRYRVEDLDHVVTGNHVLFNWVLHQVRDKVAQPQAMRALAFAASVAHAHFLAREFGRAGLVAVALDATSDRQARADAVRRLRNGELQIIVTVDLFNEGVDLPEVDTILLLRPTESATVFLQQLGRGLRRSPDKNVLTVLDFIGFQHSTFRFDLRYRALTGVSRQGLVEALTDGFPFLPSGCFIGLDQVAQEAVLANVKAHVPARFEQLVADVRVHAGLRGVTRYRLADYLDDAVMEPADIYRRTGSSWTKVCRRAGLEVAGGVTATSTAKEEALLRRVRALAHVDDLPRLQAYRRLIADPDVRAAALSGPEQRFAAMLYFTLWPNGRHPNYQEGFRELARFPAVVDELLQVWDVAEARIPHVTFALDGAGLGQVPLRVHARYTREEMLAGLGWARRDARGDRVPYGHAQGTREIPDLSADAFDVTWKKSEAAYSPTTMYRDYAISHDVIHWESPSALGSDAKAILRYIDHKAQNRHILLFARESKLGPLGTQPLMFLGRASYLSHEGERPVRFTWRLNRPLPADFYLASQLLAG